MGYAYVTSNIVDMRSAPSNRSERVNQVLYGESVRTRSRQDGFALIEQKDGYSGWVGESFLEKSARADFEGSPSMMIVAKTAKICDRSGGAIEPYILYYGTRLEGKKQSGGVFLVQLPDDRNITVKASTVQPIKKETEIQAIRVLAEARRFMGVPYLWGGITPAGFDCSGYVRAVFGRFGYDLARDTKDQVKQGEPIDRERIKSGDLVFFPGHVGIALGRDRLIHASRSGGGVRINSLVGGSDDYRADLDHSFAAARRILRCT